MKRYNIWAEGDTHESELVIEEYSLGKWVKFEDLKDIKSRDARIIKLHSKINELTHELELTKERLHLAKSKSVPLSVVEDVLINWAVSEGNLGTILKEIKQKAGLI